MHVNKVKGSAGHLDRHITREHAPDNVEIELSHLNERVPFEGGGGEKSLNKRIKYNLDQAEKRYNAEHEKPMRRRKDEVKAMSFILSGSHFQMKEVIGSNPAKLQAWVQANKEWVERSFGKQNVVEFTLHMDERTPHLHAIVTPITTDNRIAAKDFIGSASKLKALQDSYAEAMKDFQLERGKSRENVRHQTTKDFYRKLNHQEILEDVKLPEFRPIHRLNPAAYQQAVQEAIRPYVRAKMHLSTYEAHIREQTSDRILMKYDIDIENTTNLRNKVYALSHENQQLVKAYQQLDKRSEFVEHLITRAQEYKQGTISNIDLMQFFALAVGREDDRKKLAKLKLESQRKEAALQQRQEAIDKKKAQVEEILRKKGMSKEEIERMMNQASQQNPDKSLRQNRGEKGKGLGM